MLVVGHVDVVRPPYVRRGIEELPVLVEDLVRELARSATYTRRVLSTAMECTVFI
jgi:hypothetical protein